MTEESVTARSPRARAPRSRRRTGWPVAAGLILLAFVPVAAGAVRLTELGGGAAITPGNARFFAMPLPVVLHIVCVSVYSVLGAFQFVPGLRRRAWHRRSGRLLVPCGLVAALTGVWLTLFSDLPEGHGDLLWGFRLLFGTAMAVSIVLGVAAIRRRDVLRHRAWMLRGYAIGMGAGTQALTQVPWVLAFGAPTELPRTLLLGLGWVINVAVAELIIRRRGGAAGRPARV
ncbi:DUF2306 domain-containing protein [Nonomuraea sp. NPDC002799]